MIWVLGTLFVLICLLLIFMVVITPSNEGGMAATFGGMGGDSFFGTRAHQHVNKFTIFLAVAFLGLAVLINWWNSRHPPAAAGTGSLQQRLEKAAPPPAPAVPELPGGLPGTPSAAPAPPPAPPVEKK
jgi:protein translocase SecG subunit